VLFWLAGFSPGCNPTKQQNHRKIMFSVFEKISHSEIFPVKQIIILYSCLVLQTGNIFAIFSINF
jgi:hypothetical protein